MRLSGHRRSAAEDDFAAGFAKALDYVQRRVVERVRSSATTLIAAGGAPEQDDNRDWGALPLATAAASIDPAAAFDPLWWRKGYTRHVANRVDGFYSSTVDRAGEALGLPLDPDDPAIADALEGLDDTADAWGAGLADFVAGQVRAGMAEGDTVGGLASRLRDSEDSWFGAARAALLASVAVATTYNRATVAAGQSAKAQGVGSTKTWTTCVLPDTRIAGIGATRVARCWYRGRVARLLCVSGAELRVTAEHPVLTTRGWVRADRVHPGDQVVRYLGSDGPITAADPDVREQPSSAFEVFQSAHQRRPAERMVGIVVDLDGDGERTQVDVVSVDGLLRDRLQAAFTEQALEQLLAITDLDLEALFGGGDGGLLSVGVAAADVEPLGNANAVPLVRVLSSDSTSSALGAHPVSVEFQGDPDGVDRQAVAGGDRPKGVAVLVAGDDAGEVRLDGRLGGVSPVLGGDLPGPADLSGLVGLDELVDVRLDAYEGWVHDLTTSGHWFVADSIIVHNCGDDRVRDSHLEMDGETVDIAEDFLVSGAYPAAGPHDERLPVEESVNCRCWVALNVEGDLPDDETTDVQDDGAAPLDYATDGTEEDALVAGAEQFHTHGHCERCGGWLEGRSYCAKCGRGYTGPLLDAGADPSADGELAHNPRSWGDTMTVNEDAGQVATGGVDQEDAVPMTTIAPSSGTPTIVVASNTTSTANGGLEELVQRFQTADRSGQFSEIGMQPWRGVLAIEGRPTGDGRMFRQGALYWDEGFLPTDLFAMLADPDGGYGHDGSSICGRIDRMWKAPAEDGSYTEIWGEGVYDTGNPTGAEVFRLQQNGMLTGVSIDVDSVEVIMPEINSEEDLLDILFGGGVEEYSAGRIRRATVCSIPAFIEAHIRPVSDTGVLVASAASEGFRELRSWMPWEKGVVKEGGTAFLLASASTLLAPTGVKAKEADVFHSPLVDSDPPAGVFARQDYREYTPFTVDADGRISGAVSPWGECHIGFSDRCVTAPRSRTGYLHARTGHVLTAEGDIVATARVFAQFGPGRRAHAPEELAAAPAVEWYESMTLAVADVAIYEDQFGIQIQGRVRPGITRNQLVALRASRISPDWRSIGGGLECVGLAVVNVSGFTNSSRLPALVASAMEAGEEVAVVDVDELRGAAFLSGGEVLTLVASGGPTRDPASMLVGVVRQLADRLEALEQAELARQAAALLAGLPSEAEEQEALSAQMAGILDGIDLDTEAAAIEAAADDAPVTVGGLSAEELDTLRSALEITQRLTGNTEQAAAADTQTCPRCGETGIAADATECPTCHATLDGADAAGETVEAAACACDGACTWSTATLASA